MKPTSSRLLRYLVGTKAHPSKGPEALVDNVIGADTTINLPTSQQYLSGLRQHRPSAPMVVDGTSKPLTDRHQHAVMRIGGAQILAPSSHGHLPNMDKTNPVYYSKTSPRDAGLCASLTAQLRRLRIYSLTELQGALVPLLIKGQHVIAHAETGTGKSFGIALAVANKIVRDSVAYRLHTIIFTPTEELALQYDRWLKHFGGCASQICQPAISSIPLQIQLAKLHNIQPHVLVGTAQRIADIAVASPHLFGEKLRRKVDTLILDEADIILDSEVLFQKSKLTGADLVDRLYRSQPQEVPAQIVAASATIDGNTAQKINAWMRNDSVVRISTSFVEHTIPLTITFYFMSGSRQRPSNGNVGSELENEPVLLKMLTLIFKHHATPKILVFTSYPVDKVCDAINRSCSAILSKARDKPSFAKYVSNVTGTQPSQLPPLAGSLANKPVGTASADRHIRANQIIAKDKAIYVRDDENISKVSDGRMAIGVGSHGISRGLHVSGVTHVILFGEAPEASEFVHCAGRTGRMQQEGEVITIFPPSSGKRIQQVCHSLELPFKLTKESAVDALLQMDDFFDAEATADKEGQLRQRAALKRREREVSEPTDPLLDDLSPDDIEHAKNAQRQLEKIVEEQYDDVTISMDPYTRAAHLEAMLFPNL